MEITDERDILQAEHLEGEHFDAVVVDCPECEAEWADLTGKAL